MTPTRRLRVSFASATRYAKPPLIGAAYVTVLALRAAAHPATDEAQQLGAQAHQIEAVIEGRFAGDIGRIALAIVAAAFVFGLVLGTLATALVDLRTRLHGGHPLTPIRRWLMVGAVVVGLHAAIELWAMASAPQLYAAEWYALGGWRRTVQVIATDVLHPTGVVGGALAVCAIFLAAARWRKPAWGETKLALERGLRDLKSPSHPWRGVVSRRFYAHLLEDMKRRAAATAAAGVAVLVLAVALMGLHPNRARAQDDARPNVLVLAADSMRNDHLDSRTAPHLSALAERGTRFDHAYVSLPRTFPSWVTILTGRHPHHHGIRSMFPRWEDRARDFDAVPERLKRAGWATGVVSDYAGDIFSRIDLGFGRIDVPTFDFRQLVRQHVLERETPLLPVLHSRLGRAAFPVLREMNDAADPDMLARDAVRTMRALEENGPFFMVVFFSTAHFPYAAPAPYYTRFTDPGYRGRYKYDKPVGLGQEAPPDASDEQQVRALYDGAILAIDTAAQTVLDALKSDGIDKNTIVVVTADHGETLYEHGHGQGHGDHLFGDEGTHVPLVVVDPRKADRARRERAIVRDVDLAPTLYALTGVTAPADLDGRSLVPALAGRAMSPVLAYAETGLWFTEDIPGLPSDLRLPYPGIAQLTEVDTQHGDEVVLQKAMRPLALVAKHRMVRDDRYKLVYAPARSGARWILYDTHDDPGEEHDVAAAHPDVLARLQTELWTWMRRDPDMTERDGYLVPRESAALAPSADVEAGLLRIGGGGPPPGQGMP